MYSPLRSVNYKLTTLTVFVKKNKPEVTTINKNPNNYEQIEQFRKKSSGNSIAYLKTKLFSTILRLLNKTQKVCNGRFRKC